MTPVKSTCLLYGLAFALALSSALAQSAHNKARQIKIPRETRTLRVATNAEGTPVEPGATFTLFSANGAGSLERVQFAAIGDALPRRTQPSRSLWTESAIRQPPACSS